MKIIIQLFCALFIGAGAYLLFNPDFLYAWIEANLESRMLYFGAIGIRLVLGILFILAARQSKYPGVIKFIGYLAVFAAIIFIFMGHESFQDFIASLLPAIKPYAPVSGLFIIAVGSFLIYAFSGKRVPN